jgi:serine/threonine protein kinase
MNAEALIGTVLGTCTLQQVIGQSGSTAVFRAQQSRPRRQVAVKVLLPAASLTSDQQASVLQRFRREIDAAASLRHSNIVPVYECGDARGLAYLVMPYIDGETLQKVMARERALPLPKIVSYLEQLAAALDFAHEQGVIHRNIKPANIMLAPGGRLQIADFGLGYLSLEKQAGYSHLTATGTLEYTAPEQVLGEEINERADLYSLAVILYQMVTGTTPFQAVTPMRVAVQQIHTPPPSPRTMRPDLPLAAEQVMLRALAKRPADRYASGQNLVAAFRAALGVASIQLDSSASPGPATPSIGSTTSTQLFAPRGLFDPVWQTGMRKSLGAETGISADMQEAPSVLDAGSNRPTGQLKHNGTVSTQPLQNHLLPTRDSSTFAAANPSSLDVPQEKFPEAKETRAAPDTAQPEQAQLAFPGPVTTGHLLVPGYGQDGKKTMRLTESVKVVRVPVAGQPGQFVTGLLPALPKEVPPEKTASGFKKRVQMIGLIAAAVLIVLGASAFWLLRGHSSQVTNQLTKSQPPLVTPDLQATATAQAIATANANIILTDPLSQNIHNWVVSTQGLQTYIFKNGAYHITDNNSNQVAPAILQSEFLSRPFVYTLTMQEIKGDDSSFNNSFGMILCFNQQSKNGKTITTFYSFEVVNTKNGEYQFWKYEDSKGKNGSPWQKIWHHVFENEFHQGHRANTFQVVADNNKLTFIVNGKQVGTTKDSSISGGSVGMLVNLKGTEVAFTNLELTHN